jgi:hypothetical protein
MSVQGISSVGNQLQVPYAPPAAEAAAAGSSGSAAASQAVSQTSLTATQSLSTTSVAMQSQSYFGSVEQGGFEQDLLRLVIMLMLLDQILNGEQGDDSRLAALGLALGLAGGGQSSYSSSASFESLSFSQQTSMTTLSAAGVSSVADAYGSPASPDGNMDMQGGSGQRLDVTG